MENQEQAQDTVQSSPNSETDDPLFTKLKDLPTPDSKLSPAQLQKMKDDIIEERRRSKMLKKLPFSRADSINYQSWFSDTTARRFPLTAPRRPPVVPSLGRSINPITVVHRPEKREKTKRQIISEKIKKHF